MVLESNPGGERDFLCHPEGFFTDLILQLLLMLRSKVIFGAIFSGGGESYDVGNMICTDMHRLTTGIHSEKCIVRQFHRHANVIECIYTNLR